MLGGLSGSMRSDLDTYHGQHAKATDWAKNSKQLVASSSEQAEEQVQSLAHSMQRANAATATTKVKFGRVVTDLKKIGDSISSTKVLKEKEDREHVKAISELSGNADMLNGVLVTLGPKDASANASLIQVRLTSYVPSYDPSSASQEIIGVLKGLVMDMEAQKKSLETERASKNKQYSEILAALEASYYTNNLDFSRLSLDMEAGTADSAGLKAENSQIKEHAADLRGVSPDIQSIGIKASRGPENVAQFESELEGEVAHARSLINDILVRQGGNSLALVASSHRLATRNLRQSFSPIGQKYPAAHSSESEQPLMNTMLEANFVIGDDDAFRAATLSDSRQGRGADASYRQDDSTSPALVTARASPAALKLLGNRVPTFESRDTSPMSVQQRDLRRRLRDLFQDVGTTVAAKAIRRGARQFKSDALLRLADKIGVGTRSESLKLLGALSLAVTARASNQATVDTQTVEDCEQRRLAAMAEAHNIQDEGHTLKLRNATLLGEIQHLRTEESSANKHRVTMSELQETLPTLNSGPAEDAGDPMSRDEPTSAPATLEFKNQLAEIHDTKDLVKRLQTSNLASAGEVVGLQESLDRAKLTLEGVIKSEKLWMDDLESDIARMRSKLDGILAKALQETQQFTVQMTSKEAEYQQVQDKMAAVLVKWGDAQKAVAAAEQSCTSVNLLASSRLERASREEGFLAEAMDMLEPPSAATRKTIIF